MRYAIVDGVKTIAAPGETAFCPMCDGDVISKCGSIKVWHWAHKILDCDHWSEPESEWHLKWKSHASQMFTEITIEHSGIKHRADLLLPDETVVELQHSNISVESIAERETFYGKMIWLFDVSEVKGFELKGIEESTFRSLRWKHPRLSWLSVKSPVYFDTGSDIFVPSGNIKIEKFPGHYDPKIPAVYTRRSIRVSGFGRLMPHAKFVEYLKTGKWSLR